MPSESSKPIPHVEELLVPVSPERGYADYLAKLAEFLPHSISQFGLVLTTAAELRQTPGKQIRSKDPNQSEETASLTGLLCPRPPPHYLSIEMPITTAAEAGSVKTLIDVTISGHAVTFFPRCEEDLMKAAIDEAAKIEQLDASKAADSATETNAACYLKKATADPVIVAHNQNVRILLSSIVEYLGELRAGGGRENSQHEMFYCVNDVWMPALRSLGNLTKGTRAVKFVMTEKKLLENEAAVVQDCERIEREEGLVLGPMEERDIQQMINVNAVPYSEHYGRHIIKTSQCFRSKSGEMVAWAGSHEDFSVAALHVLPAYRKMGLGRLVLMRLALAHMRLARSILDTLGADAKSISSETLMAHADCIDDNHPTMVFMERCGWTRVGIHNWIGLLTSSAN
ncbi:hypothetical protein EMPS_08573 [Entomortierella parvispora]|uniref:N-acetyltransferase domain-containing protein n=1 Tax=Entomortierella parvispora TaxID=205924 RepID=A0A9P3HGD6_9FUNG|nr:hypothetical protein EMPS_08573 [Entomortierella parvispora]